MPIFFGKMRRKHGKRATLQAFLAFDDRRLNDLGLSRFDLADAMKAHRDVGSLLSARRSEHAAFWMR